jgi:hypothetical protein
MEGEDVCWDVPVVDEDKDVRSGEILDTAEGAVGGIGLATGERGIRRSTSEGASSDRSGAGLTVSGVKI